MLPSAPTSFSSCATTCRRRSSCCFLARIAPSWWAGAILQCSVFGEAVCRASKGGWCTWLRAGAARELTGREEVVRAAAVGEVLLCCCCYCLNTEYGTSGAGRSAIKLPAGSVRKRRLAYKGRARCYLSTASCGTACCLVQSRSRAPRPTCLFISNFGWAPAPHSLSWGLLACSDACSAQTRAHF